MGCYCGKLHNIKLRKSDTKTDILTTPDDFRLFEAMQRDYIIAVLNFTNWRVCGQKGAAITLNIKDKSLFAKIRRLGIKKISLKSSR